MAAAALGPVVVLLEGPVDCLLVRVDRVVRVRVALLREPAGQERVVGVLQVGAADAVDAVETVETVEAGVGTVVEGGVVRVAAAAVLVSVAVGPGHVETFARLIFPNRAISPNFPIPPCDSAFLQLSPRPAPFRRGLPACPSAGLGAAVGDVADFHAQPADLLHHPRHFP